MIVRLQVDLAGSFRSVEAQNSEVQIPTGSDVCHWGCVFTVIQTVQRPGVYSAVYGTVHNKEPLKSFDKSREHSRLRASFCHDIAMIMQKVK